MVCAIAAAVVGCAGTADDAGTPGPELPDPAPQEGQLRLAFHTGAGDAPGGIFASKDDVFLRTSIDGDGAALAGAELAFAVVDAQGRHVSIDRLDCRRFRVEGNGSIVSVVTGYDVTGAPCRHPTSVLSNGAMQVQLAPFADVAPNADGLMEYTVVVARSEHVIDGAFPAGAFRGSILVEPEEDFPSCGDGHVDPGEGCDDGNHTNGDGCSSECTSENHCGGGGGGGGGSPVCGNGVLESGEGCDDGDTDGGDGCSPTCQIEVIP